MIAVSGPFFTERSGRESGRRMAPACTSAGPSRRRVAVSASISSYTGGSLGRDDEPITSVVGDVQRTVATGSKSNEESMTSPPKLARKLHPIKPATIQPATRPFIASPSFGSLARAPSNLCDRLPWILPSEVADCMTSGELGTPPLQAQIGWRHFSRRILQYGQASVTCRTIACHRDPPISILALEPDSVYARPAAPGPSRPEAFCR